MAGYAIKDKSDLERKHPEYKANIKKWIFYSDAYDGDDEFIRQALIKNERESTENHRARLKEGICFGYSSAVVDIFNHFLTEKTIHRDMGWLANDAQWQLFMKDCTLDGTSFDDFLTDQQKVASIFGMCGILIDKPNSGNKKMTAKQEALKGIYPYAVPFTMPDIFDWEFERNETTGRFELVFLKLRIDQDAYMIWTKASWEIFKLVKQKVLSSDSGENPLGEIPFVWLYNTKSIFDGTLGKSDLVGVAKIQASITRDMSCADEIIKYAGFPMLVMPMESEDDMVGASSNTDDDDDDNDVVVSSKSVLQFNPEFPDGKPDWLESKVLEPIRAILELIDRKTDEMYRTVHLSGIYNQRDKAQTKSGVALKYEYHQLNSVLSKKAKNLTTAEMRIIYFFLKWKNKAEKISDVSVKRADEFSIDELADTLDNIIKGINTIKSGVFAKAMKKQIMEKLAPNLSRMARDAVIKEIEAAVESFGVSEGVDNAA